MILRFYDFIWSLSAIGKRFVFLVLPGFLWLQAVKYLGYFRGFKVFKQRDKQTSKKISVFMLDKLRFLSRSSISSSSAGRRYPKKSFSYCKQLLTAEGLIYLYNSYNSELPFPFRHQYGTHQLSFPKSLKPFWLISAQCIQTGRGWKQRKN